MDTAIRDPKTSKPDLHDLIESIHTAPGRAVIMVTGGGTSALTWLLSVPGASNTVIEAAVPYSAASLADLLGREPDQAVSKETARSMAGAAYRRALSLRKDGSPVAGIACTAAIATDRPRRGGHRCHVAAWTAGGVTTYSLRLSKGIRDRTGEDAVVGSVVVRALAEAFDLEGQSRLFSLRAWSELPHCHSDRSEAERRNLRPPSGSGLFLDEEATSDRGGPLPVSSTLNSYQSSLGLDEAEELEVDSEVYEDPLRALLAGHVSHVAVARDGAMEADGPVGRALLPGSFNPLHAGHVEMAKVAADMLDSEVTCELSVANVDKPPLDEEEVRARCARFEGLAPVVISRAPVFHEKARLFPGRTFVIGADTAERLVQPRYYDGSESRMLVALDETRRLGCRFLVSGRARDGVFRTLSDIPLPEEFAGMFSSIPESRFRSDASSTELRLAGRGC